MGWQFTPYAVFLFLASAVVLGLAAFLWRYRSAPGAAPIAVMLVAAGVWDLGAGLELSAAELPAKLVWAKVQYLGIVSIPVAWIVFALGYTGRDGWLTWRSLLLLSVVPAVTLLLVATNESHGLIWSRTELVREGGMWHLHLGHGPAFWVNWAYAYLLLLSGTVMLALTLFRSSRVYQMQGSVLLVAVAAPWFGNVLYVLDFDLLGELDPTPFAFAVCGAAMFYGISSHHLLDLAPVARTAIFDYIKDGVLVIDRRGRVADVNSVARSIPELPQKSEIISARAPGLRSDLAELLTGASSQGELRLGGWRSPRDYAGESYEMRDRKDRLRGRLVLLRDVTEKLKVQEQLRQSEERYRAVVEQAAEGIFLCDKQTRRIVESNAAFQRLLGYSADELAAMTIYDLAVHDRDNVDENIRLVSKQQAASLGERRYRRKDGTLIDIGISSSLVSYGGREVLCTVVRDFTGRKALERRLEHRAFHDPLTELPNRALFTQRLHHAVSEGEAVALLFVDLDDFKSINDDLGHECGDELLIQVANRLAGCLRSDDFAARLGGDEFMVLIRGASDADEAQAVARRVEDRLQAPFSLGGRSLRVGASIGLVFSGSGEQSAEDLTRKADAAMYEAKRAGKARLSVAPEAQRAASAWAAARYEEP